MAMPRKDDHSLSVVRAGVGVTPLVAGRGREAGTTAAARAAAGRVSTTLGECAEVGLRTRSGGTPTTARRPSRCGPWSTRVTSTWCRAASLAMTNRPICRVAGSSSVATERRRSLAEASSGPDMPTPSSITSITTPPPLRGRPTITTWLRGGENAVALSSSSAMSRTRSLAA